MLLLLTTLSPIFLSNMILLLPSIAFHSLFPYFTASVASIAKLAVIEKNFMVNNSNKKICAWSVFYMTSLQVHSNSDNWAQQTTKLSTLPITYISKCCALCAMKWLKYTLAIQNFCLNKHLRLCYLRS